MLMEKTKSFISGIGYYAPENILTNSDLEKIVDTSDEWITTRTGIKSRHVAENGETSSVIGIKAAEMAIKNAGIDRDNIDLVITATITPDMVFPATGCLIQEGLGLKHAGAFDLEAACSGFIYSLSIADSFISKGVYKNVLVVATETLSKITNWEDRSTCILFGDGAGAAVISKTDIENQGIINYYLRSAGEHKDLLKVHAGGSLQPASEETVKNKLHTISMIGNEVFKLAIKSMEESARNIIEEAGISMDDIDHIIPHQANIRIIKMLAKQLDCSMDKIIVNLDKYGNTSAASIPIAMAEYVENGTIKRGDKILMVAFGGGMTWGGLLLDY